MGGAAFSSAMTGGITPSRREHWYLVAIFCATLAAQFYCTTLNWKAGFMPHHEFRQSQTALISYYIDKQDNFSLLYETPIVGKPWVSILMEVPIYEWSVVLLSRAAGVPHVVAARSISLACFYLALPALYLLLARFAVPAGRRLLILSLVVACPVYIFYSRAFLMDSMEVMFCAWFLLGFVRSMDGRRWTWLAVAIVAGIGAALVKNVTYAVWLAPAAAYGVWVLVKDFRARAGWPAIGRTVLWGAGTVTPSLIALWWWIKLTDPIKEAHASAWLFTSKNLSRGNWGLLDFGTWISPKVWGILVSQWKMAILPPWLIAMMVLGGLVFFPRQRRPVLILGAAFIFAQLLFPYAYAYQDYYYYSCALFLSAALGFVLIGLLDSRVPKWLGWPLLLLPLAAGFHTYWRSYHADQMITSKGGFNYTEAIRDLSPKNSVIVVAGGDWAAIVPLYAERKALMIRNGLEFDAKYLHRAFDDLAGENVSALVLIGPLRTNRALLNLAAEKFNLDSSAPTYSEGETDVYFARPYIASVQDGIAASVAYPMLTIGHMGPEQVPAQVPFNISTTLARNAFRNISPAPYRGLYEHGVAYLTVDGVSVLGAHPESNLWIQPPVGAKRIKWDYGIMAEAYERAGDKTDGVEFIIIGETPDGNRRQIYQRIVDPARNPADRGEQHVDLAYEPREGEHLIVSSRPNLSPAYDWAYWVRFEVK